VKPTRRHKQFKKHFKIRIVPNKKLILQFQECLILFKAGHRGYLLNDHALTGKLAGKRAFSVAGNIRVVYEETEDVITFLDIGSHNQVYR